MTCKYNAGMLRTPCQFQRKTLTSDGSGGFFEAWAPLSGSAKMCAFRAMSGSERWAAQRVEATSRNRVTCRFFEGLRESDRVVIKGRAYAISFINQVELRDWWLEIDVSSGVAT